MDARHVSANAPRLSHIVLCQRGNGFFFSFDVVIYVLLEGFFTGLLGQKGSDMA